MKKVINRGKRSKALSEVRPALHDPLPPSLPLFMGEGIFKKS